MFGDSGPGDSVIVLCVIDCGIALMLIGEVPRLLAVLLAPGVANNPELCCDVAEAADRAGVIGGYDPP